MINLPINEGYHIRKCINTYRRIKAMKHVTKKSNILLFLIDKNKNNPINPTSNKLKYAIFKSIVLHFLF